MSLHARPRVWDFRLNLVEMSKRFKRCGTDLTVLTVLTGTCITALYPFTRAFAIKPLLVIYLKTRAKSFLYFYTLYLLSIREGIYRI